MTEVLLETSQLLQRADSDEEIFKCVARQIQRLLGRSATFQQVWNDKTTATIHPSNIEKAAAEWVAIHGRKAGAGTSQFPESHYLYMAINGQRGVLAVVILEMEGHPAMDEFEKNLLVSMLGECALAIEKEEANALRNKASLQAQNEQLRANLMRAVSHDLRTPLTSISGNAALLLENADSLSNDRKSLLYRDIQEEAQWLNRLVENLLSVTRIENGSMDIRLFPELMSEVIHEAITHLERLRTGHIIDVELSDDLLMGKMDSRLVVQLLINLVDNAFKYTDPAGRVHLRAMRQQSFVLVRVEDEGPGIPETMKENLFGMFVTLDSRESGRRRGMGLGLYLCRAIVHAHGGEIWVEDREQGGAAFCFTLPAEEVPFGDETESSGN